MHEARTITVVEYGSIPVGGSREGDYLTRDEAEELVGRRKDFGCKNWWEWFRRGHETLIAGSWVGTINLGTVQVTVLPKIEPLVDGEGLEASKAAAAPQADLVRMLHVAGVIDIRPKQVPHVSEGGNLTDLLARLYCQKLRHELLRGLPRGYQPREDALRLFRGRLDIGRQMRLDATASGMLACAFDVFEPDTALNRVLKAALRSARRLTAGGDIRAEIGRTLALLDEVSDVAVRPADAGHVRLARNETHLRDLLGWAKLFLHARQLDLRGAAGGQKGAGLMFRMWDIYERYVVNELNRVYETHHRLHGGPRLTAEAQVTGWHLATYSEGEVEQAVFNLKPDIVIYRDGEPIMVADTKWKTVADETTVKLGNLGIQPADAYQLFAYSRVIGEDKPLPVALIYPTVESLESQPPVDTQSPLSHLGEPLRAFKLESPKGPRLTIHRFRLPVQNVF